MAEKNLKNGVIDQEMIEVDFQDAAAAAYPARSGKATKSRSGKIFPVGIFFMLLFIESILAAGASAAYFFYAGKSGVAAIESYTRSYSLPLAEAFGAMTEMCYRSKNYARLRALFREKIEQKMIGEAFVVLKDGRLIAHSSPEMEKSLKGNLAGDEFAYNLDLLLQPVRRKSREVLFTDYNITSKSVPYERDMRAALKKYFYAGVDTTGWLVSRAVYGKKKKPIGAVCFIISKETGVHVHIGTRAPEPPHTRALAGDRVRRLPPGVARGAAPLPGHTETRLRPVIARGPDGSGRSGDHTAYGRRGYARRCGGGRLFEAGDKRRNTGRGKGVAPW